MAYLEIAIIVEHCASHPCHQEKLPGLISAKLAMLVL